jgi:hypothetical protein
MKDTSPIDERAEILVKAYLTGELRNNSREINEQAVRELLAGNAYWSLKLEAVEELELDYDEAIKRLAKACGLDLATFMSHTKSYIDPLTTMQSWDRALEAIDRAATAGDTILFATGHPGSLLELYRRLAGYAKERGATIVDSVERVRTPGHHYLDTVAGVIVLSDEGSLLHTHDGESLREVIRAHKPALVVSDHGFAAAAINEKVPTVAIFDSDDPALPLAASVRDDVIAVPMNDNQTNLHTALAVTAALNLGSSW